MRFAAIPPRRVPTTGDDTPARSLLRYVWRMSGRHQVWICLLALVVASLGMAPLELQRRIVNRAVGETDLDLLALLGATYLAVILGYMLAVEPTAATLWSRARPRSALWSPS